MAIWRYTPEWYICEFADLEGTLRENSYKSMLKPATQIEFPVFLKMFRSIELVSFFPRCHTNLNVLGHVHFAGLQFT